MRPTLTTDCFEFHDFCGIKPGLSAAVAGKIYIAIEEIATALISTLCFTEFLHLRFEV